MSNSVRPHRQQPTRLPCPWDSPGKNTGVGCHFLLQCMKVKSESESEVAQSCPTLSHPMDCSLQGSSVHGIFQARVLEWGAIAFSVFTSELPSYHCCIRVHLNHYPINQTHLTCRSLTPGQPLIAEVLLWTTFWNNIWKQMGNLFDFAMGWYSQIELFFDVYSVWGPDLQPAVGWPSESLEFSTSYFSLASILFE